MCFGSSGTNSTTTVNSVPPFLQQGLTSLFGQAEATSSIPYSPYPGPTVAPLSQQQTQGIGQAQQYSQAAQPWLQNAGQYAANSTQQIAPSLQQFGQSQFNSLSNPFTQGVIGTSEQELQRQLAIGQQGVAGQAAQQGAWGGDRAAIAQSELARNEGQLGGQLASQLNLQNFQQAQSQFNTQQNQQIAAQESDAQRAAQASQLMTGIGTQVQGQGIQGAEALTGAGALEQQQGQANINSGYQQFLNQRNWPMQQLQTLSGAIQGFPTNAFAGSTTTSPGPSAFSQIGGAGLAGLGIAGSLGAFKGGSGGFSGLFGGSGSGGTGGGGYGGASYGGYGANGGMMRASGGAIGGNGGSPSKRYASGGLGANLGQFSHMPKIPAGFGSHMGSISGPKFRPAFRAIEGQGGSLNLKPRPLGYLKKGGVAGFDAGGSPTYDMPTASGAPDAKSMMAAKQQQFLQAAAPNQKQQLQRAYANFNPFAVQNMLNMPRVPGVSVPMGQAAALGMQQPVYTGQAAGGAIGYDDGGAAASGPFSLYDMEAMQQPTLQARGGVMGRAEGGQVSETQKLLQQAEGGGTTTTTGGGGGGGFMTLLNIGGDIAKIAGLFGQGGGIRGHADGDEVTDDEANAENQYWIGRGWGVVPSGGAQDIDPTTGLPLDTSRMPDPNAQSPVTDMLRRAYVNPGVTPPALPSYMQTPQGVAAPPNQMPPTGPQDVHPSVMPGPVASTTPNGTPVVPHPAAMHQPMAPHPGGAAMISPSGQPIGASGALMDAAVQANQPSQVQSQPINQVGQGGDQGQQGQQYQGYQPNPWLAMAAAGAGMMASPSKFAGVNIGRGLTAGLSELDRQRQIAAQDQMRRAQMQGLQQYRQSTIDARQDAINERYQAALLASGDRKLSVQQRADAARDANQMKGLMAGIAQQNADTNRMRIKDQSQVQQDKTDQQAAAASLSLTEKLAPRDPATNAPNPSDPAFRVQHDSYMLKNYPESQQGKVIKSQLGVPMPLPPAVDGKANPAYLMPGQTYQTAKGNARWNGSGFEPITQP